LYDNGKREALGISVEEQYRIARALERVESGSPAGISALVEAFEATTLMVAETVLGKVRPQLEITAALPSR
jgi:hypothetical protein